VSTDWVKDIHDMHTQFGFREKIVGLDQAKMLQLLNFRAMFLREELTETLKAIDVDRDPEEIVDGLIDLCVVAIGTLDLFGIDAYKAWDRVHKANVSKEVGIKESRPNPLGLPDLIKPTGWQGPSHEDNHGTLKDCFE
jgi:predicted HAD superfamily Cof-like phosphohydrolase